MNTRFNSLIAVLLAATVFLSGCMTIKNELPAPGPDARISFGPLDGGTAKPVVRHFSEHGRATFWFFYLIPKNHLDGYELAKREIKEGEAIQNLKITTKYDLVDFFCGFISIVFGTYRINVEGEVVKA